MRLFVAADLSEAARAAVAKEQARIASATEGGGTLKWVAPDHAHLTLVFLGEVADARVPPIVDALGRDVPLDAFEVSLETIGMFPARGAPRVLWLGVGPGAALLGDLQKELARRVDALGVPLEPRPFHPHLTLARWRDSRASDRERVMGAARRGAIARVRIDGATLFQSRVSSAGSAYTALARANLIGRPASG